MTEPRECATCGCELGPDVGVMVNGEWFCDECCSDDDFDDEIGDDE